jgi:putative phosphoserine phosphatase/1-acylglycerol-3-phosphate O-acyltransferase
MYTNFIKIYRWVTVLTTMLVIGTISLFLVLVSFGLLRNFCIKYIFKYSSRFLLKINGYGYVLPDIDKFSKHQVLYTINHNSYIDIFLLTSVGLPDTRFILSEVTLKYVPMVISAKAIGTFYIPQKKHEKRRLRFFLKITSFLKKTNYSVISSPEGVSPYVHGINPFNKGIFHMAMEAKIPIVPLYIHIPKSINPYNGKYSKSGIIHLEVLKEIDTSEWKLENIWEHIAKVRNVYVDRFNELNGTNIE